LHVALAIGTDDAAFAAEPVRGEDIGRWTDAAIEEANRGFSILEQNLARLSDEVRPDVSVLLSAKAPLLDRLEAARRLAPSGVRTRIHGDYHLGQVLVAQDDVMIIDFEGEPQRELAERRDKGSGLRDVAGMLRSFDYAAWSAVDRLRTRNGHVDTSVMARAFAWRDQATRAFLQAYWNVATPAGILPQDMEERQELLDLFRLQKAFYEVGYEAANRPSWLSIPVRGILELIASPIDMRSGPS
jgi:maltose alpha-D-glucosyltransferase/alpha-amylase